MLLLPGVINNRLNLKSGKNWVELFARNLFLQCYPHCFSEVLPTGGSDHSPIIFPSNSHVFLSNWIFSFQRQWLSNPEFPDILRFLLEQWHSKRPHLFQEVASLYKQIARVQELFLGRICIRLILICYIKRNFTGLNVQGLIGLNQVTKILISFFRTAVRHQRNGKIIWTFGFLIHVIRLSCSFQNFNISTKLNIVPLWHKVVQFFQSILFAEARDPNYDHPQEFGNIR